MPAIDKIIDFENGELTEDEVIELFQDGVNKGWVWQLQGHYGRLAAELLARGLIVGPETR